MSQKQSTDPTAAVDVEPISKFAEDIAGSTDRSRLDAHRIQGEINVALEDWAAQPRAIRLVVILLVRERCEFHDEEHRKYPVDCPSDVRREYHAARARALREAARLLEAIEEAL